MNAASPVPWYRNAIALTSYATQALGLLMVVASFIVANPPAGLPSWVLPLCGLILALGSQLGLQAHSANVRTAEITAASQPPQAAPAAAAAAVPAPPAPPLAPPLAPLPQDVPRLKPPGL